MSTFNSIYLSGTTYTLSTFSDVVRSPIQVDGTLGTCIDVIKNNFLVLHLSSNSPFSGMEDIVILPSLIFSNGDMVQGADSDRVFEYRISFEDGICAISARLKVGIPFTQ